MGDSIHLLHAIFEQRFDDALSLIKPGLDLNQPVDEGASPLFAAILAGHLPLIKCLLQAGADPNLHAQEPASFTYAPTPLDLAMQARFLMDWDKFHAVVKLLHAYGALDADGQSEIPNVTDVEQRARAWQRNRA
jgi:ankyrin repeat protein